MKNLLTFFLLILLFSCSNQEDILHIEEPFDHRNQVWSNALYSYSEEEGVFKDPFVNPSSNGDPLKGVIIEQHLLELDPTSLEFITSVETSDAGNFEFLYADDEKYIYTADLSSTNYNATFGLNTNLNLSVVAFERKETVILFRSNDNAKLLNKETIEYEFSRPTIYGSLGDFVDRSDNHDFIEDNLIANCGVNVNLELKFRMKGDSDWGVYTFYRDASINQYDVWVD